MINQIRPGQAAEHGASEALQIYQRANPRYLVALLGTNNATGNGVRIVDIRAAPGPGEMTDRSHPNDRNQQIIGQMFASQIH